MHVKLAISTAIFILLIVCPVFVNGQSTQSADLEHTNDEYFDISDAAQTGLDITSDMTVELWLNAETDPSNSSENTTYTPIAKWDGGGVQSWILQYRDVSGTNEFRTIIVTSGGNKFCSITQDIGTATWAHVAFTFDASASEVQMFVDGSSIGTCTNQGSDIDDSAAAFYVGAQKSPGGAEHWDGKIFDARVWSAERTTTELSDNKDCHVATDATNLEGNWYLDGDALDATSNNNDLTNNNTVPFVSDIPSSHTGEPCGGGEPAAPAPLLRPFVDWFSYMRSWIA